jgi:hypothetical protein
MISTDQILQYFPNKSYDEALLTARRELVETIYLRKFLGKDFFNELRAQYKSDTLTAENSEFLREYLQPLLAHYCMYDSLAYLQAQPRSNGLEFTLPEFGQKADKADVGLTVNKILATAESLVELAKEYLKDNASLYPLYKCGKDMKGYTGIVFYDSYSQVNLDKNV